MSDDQFGTTASKVERAIRHAIEVAWNRGRVDTLNRAFGCRVCTPEDKPTNGEFIAMLADKMSMEILDMFARAERTSWEQESAAKRRLAQLAPVLEEIFSPFDAVLGASCGIVAPLGLGATGPSDFIKFWMAFGLPQVNIPLVRKAAELPVGLQIIGGFRNDSLLLSVAEQVDALLRPAGR